MSPVSKQSLRRVLALVGVAATCGLAASAGAAAAGAETNVTATYSCTATVPILGTKTFTGSGTVKGTTPAKVAPGAAVKMTGFQATVTIPASEVNQMISFGITSISGKATVVDVNATDAKTATVNAAGKGILIPTTKLLKNTPVVLTLPKTAISVGSWTASTAGLMEFKSGTVKATINTSFGAIPVSCAAKPPAVISKTTVS